MTIRIYQYYCLNTGDTSASFMFRGDLEKADTVILTMSFCTIMVDSQFGNKVEDAWDCEDRFWLGDKVCGYKAGWRSGYSRLKNDVKTPLNFPMLQ